MNKGKAKGGAVRLLAVITLTAMGSCQPQPERADNALAHAAGSTHAPVFYITYSPGFGSRDRSGLQVAVWASGEVVRASPPTAADPELRATVVTEQVVRAFLEAIESAGFFGQPETSSAVPSSSFFVVAVREGAGYRERFWRATRGGADLLEVGDGYPSDPLLRAVFAAVSSMGDEGYSPLTPDQPLSNWVFDGFGRGATFPRVAAQ